MKFSTRTLYGLKAILLLASRYGEGSVSVSQIAKKESLSVAYLEQILNALKKKGIVKSVRGPQGGYVLAQKPADVTLESLFYLLNEESRAIASATGSKPADQDESSIANWIFWKRFQTSIQEGLGGASLKDLLDEARRIKKSKPGSQSQVFHI